MQGFSKHLSRNKVQVPQNHIFKITDIKNIAHQLKLVPLNASVAEIDYSAVLLNMDRLTGIFGDNDPWPDPKMTFQQNLNSLRVHHLEFESEKAFAYSVISIDSKKCFGSVYIDPSEDAAHDCEVYFWLCKSLPVNRKQFAIFLSDWLSSAWKFKSSKIHKYKDADKNKDL
ncbi:hypothetical protein [Pseudoalteromonas luteoviolacea]|uniref:hypothetical protein n=1 Tax=Pseudoalteromonas luteoviolacea TaxID=43657 RepID=UPI0007B03E00|nr:hypothetical protein [Pseudoalteromonas luteoviolacea]KZN54736.1 hypothetical protein N474_17655 [Pseudoalteromonas luteoviolacea CPMOR-2]TQF70720.1 hypothetical protein FLM44_06425 [Pseudoalteromonas luteoviolacea]